METETKPHPQRRKHETLNHIVEVFIGRQSRKVAFGVWLFIVSTALLKLSLISAAQWMICMYLSTGLIGFGTVIDSILEKLGDRIADKAAEKINNVTAVVTTETTVQTAAQ